jgi:hypothetical protein
MTITLTREEAQQVLDALEWNLPVIEDFGDKEQLHKQHKSIETLRARLAQPEPEPGCIVENGRVHGLVKSKPAVMNADKWQPLYTTPPQRNWQGLTDEEIMSLLPGAVRLPPGWSETVRAIEAKLKEKNNAL